MPDMLITTHLEMTSRAAFRPAYVNGTHFSINRMKTPDVSFYRFLYGAVGEQWRWRDRLLLSEEELYNVIADSSVSVDVLYVHGVPAGYVELARQGTDTEIAYFGLRPAFFGMGYGKHLLSHGIAHAWSDGARRVWVHTCNLDGPHALDNYTKRGFSVFHVEKKPMPMRYQ
ncbi:MAG: GNAT family N-acetyltransferase [Chloroflexi bacterium]|nr:GNAT family N-acetyltransferase [Chloroflexota bacterium]